MIEFAFPWPTSQGEWLAWSSAAAAALFGLAMLVAPRAALAIMHFARPAETPQAVAELRSRAAGFQLGLGLACMLLAQPLLYLALGASWGFAALGRLAGVLFDRGARRSNLVWLVVEAGLATMPLAYVLGYVR